VSAQEVTPDAVSSVVSDNVFTDIVERSDDSLLIFEFKIGKIRVSEALLTYEDFDTGDYYVPLGDVLEALEFPIEVDNDAGSAQGWFIRAGNDFALSLGDKSVVVRGSRSVLKKGYAELHDDGVYVSLKALESWFPMTVDVDFSNLAIVVSTLETFPIEARMERDKARGGINKDGQIVERRNFLVKLDAPRFTVPFIDTSLQTNYTNEDTANKALGFRFSSTARSIIFGQDALYTVNDQTDDDESPSVRLTIGRKAFEGDALYGGVQEYKLGDVSSRSIPLVARSNAGRGVFVSNIADGQNFVSGSDNITLRGELAVGYQVDIKRNGELLDFIEEPDGNGEYIFEDLFVLPGLNVFELVFYGPQGQEIVEERRVFVPANPVQKGQFGYRFHAIQDNTNLFTNRDDEDEDTGELRVTGEVNYGLTKLTSVHGGVASYSMDGEQKRYGFAGLVTSLRGVRLDVNHAINSDGNASSVRLESEFKGFRWQAQHQYYSQFVSEDNVDAGISGDLEHETEVRVSGILPFLFLKGTPLTLQGTRLQNEEGDEDYEWSLRATKNISKVRLTTELAQDIPALNERSTDLNLQVSSRFEDFTLRGTAQYALEPEAVLESLNLTSDITLDEKTKLRLGVSRSGADDPLHALSVGLNRDLGYAQVGFNTSYDDDQTLTALLGMSFGFAYDGRKGEPYFSSSRLSGTSAVFARVFDDLDADSEWEEGEPYLEEVGFSIRGNKREFDTDESGQVFIPELRSYERSTLDILSSTFPDPFMRSDPSRIDYLMRPSQVHVRDYPVVLTGEVDGTVSIMKARSKRPAASIMLDILRPDGTLSVSGSSEYDGFFLISNVPGGQYSIEPNKEQIQELGYCPVAAQPVVINADEPFYSVEDEFLLYADPERVDSNRWIIMSDFVSLEDGVALRDQVYSWEQTIEEDLQDLVPATEISQENGSEALSDDQLKRLILPRYIQKSGDDLYRLVSGPYDDLSSLRVCEYFKANGAQCVGIEQLDCAGLNQLLVD
jgi:hypothetical protein